MRRFRESDPPTMLVFTIIYCAVVLILIGGLIVAHCHSSTPAMLVFTIIYGMFVAIFGVCLLVACLWKLPTKRGR
jgi:RsiW-degrading membrane proteinase PrsW (M82 family)